MHIYMHPLRPQLASKCALLALSLFDDMHDTTLMHGRLAFLQMMQPLVMWVKCKAHTPTVSYLLLLYLSLLARHQYHMWEHLTPGDTM